MHYANECPHTTISRQVCVCVCVCVCLVLKTFLMAKGWFILPGAPDNNSVNNGVLISAAV